MISGNKEATKAYLSSVISEIWVSQGEVKILGGSCSFAAAVSGWTQDTQIPAVPSVGTNMARLARFERATAWFVARYSIQLSYRRVEEAYYRDEAVIRQAPLQANIGC